MIFRLASENDIPGLAELRWLFRTEIKDPSGITIREEFVPACEQFMRRALRSGNWAVWVVEADGQIVAQAFIEIIERLPSLESFQRSFGYVTNVYTRPKYRNQGIGAELMRRLQAWAVERGLESLLLWPNLPAIPFYERLGFKFAQEAMEWQTEAT